ncbi:MAG: murein biosynthesis integral membrane protein MurJ [Patescibacteria group bacterium]|nr:murein biosynthesis integral membrane protein MurJ [Patescibacteria group bacterium]
MKRFFGLFSKENSIRGASIILIITLALSNILGLLRDRFLAKNISTYNLDIYYASFRIPDLIFNLLILGAISSAFIPIFSEFIAKKKEKEGFDVTNNLLNTALLFTIISAVILYIFMPFLIPLIVPKFDAVRLQQTIKLSRLMMITPIFFSISYILGGVLNSFKRFLSYSLAPLVYNLSIIFGAAVLAPKYGMIAVVYSVIAGSFLHLLIQLPSAIKLGFRYKFIFNFKEKAFRRIIALMIPRTIGMSANQLLLIVYTAIASSLAIGSISAFSLSNNMQTMPTVVFGTSFATAVFPTLTAKIANNDNEGFAFYLDRSMRAIAFLLIPSSIIFILLRAQIVRLILGSGKFNWNDTRMTAMALGLFSISLLAQGITPLLAKAFYALKNTKTPMYISIITVIVSIILAYPLANLFGVAGLAFAFSIGSFVNAIILFISLSRAYPGGWHITMIYSYAKITLISVVMGFFVWATAHLMADVVDMTRFHGVLTQTMVASCVGVLTYWGLSHLFGCDELKWVLTRKINGKIEKSLEEVETAEYEKV